MAGPGQCLGRSQAIIGQAGVGASDASGCSGCWPMVPAPDVGLGGCDHAGHDV